MSEAPKLPPQLTVENAQSLSEADLNDLCDATDAAIASGGGFGWVHLPAREILERYWQGVMAMPNRMLFVARLDGTICGTCQLVFTPRNNEAQSKGAHLTTTFVTPWARGYGLARRVVEAAENAARKEGIEVLNLDVRETQDAAIALYESMGYTHWGTHPHYAVIDGAHISGRFYYKQL